MTESEAPIAPLDYWQDRYGGDERTWSGRPNQVLVDVAADLPRGRAVDLGCGEGADAIWLARNGWRTTGVDISSNAVRKAAEAAREAGISEADLDFVAADLSTWTSDERFDLVTASFLHSPVELSRVEILRAAAERVAPSGHLLIVTHADFPPWADQAMRDRVRHAQGDDQGHPDHGHRDHEFLTPQQEVEQLALDPAQWTVVLCESRSRQASGPGGEQAMLDDGVVLLRRADSA